MEEFIEKSERTKYMKRTQGIMSRLGGIREAVLPETDLASKIAMYVDGNDINGSEANT
jgi:hypothetical protein